MPAYAFRRKNLLSLLALPIRVLIIICADAGRRNGDLMAKNSVRRKIAERYNVALAKNTEIPIDALNGSHIEILSNNELSIDGQKGLLVFSDNEIKFSLGDKNILISGNKLDIRQITADAAVIAGVIEKIEFQVL